MSGATTAAGACSVPGESLIRFVPDEDIVPGQAVWKPGVCTLCRAGCGLTVRLMDADADVARDGQTGIKRILAAKKLEGNPEHPVNHGRLCVRGQAGIQVTYHPDRITQPLRRTGDRGTGRYEAIGWEEALAELARRLDAVRTMTGPSRLAWLGRGDAGHRGALVAAFVKRLGGIGPIAFDVFGDDVLRQANARSFGRHQLPTFDLARARYVLSLGADFLGTWNSPVAQSASYGAMRQGRRGMRGTFVQVESRMTQTGANADEWLPANPGTEGALALGLAHVIMSSGARGAVRADAAGRAGAQIEEWADGLPSYNPAAVAGFTGVSATRIERLATELVENRPAVVLVSGPPLAHTNGLFTALAVNALNALLGARDQPGGFSFTPQANVAAMAKLDAMAPPSTDTSSWRTFLADRLTNSVSTPELLVVDGINPIFTAPPAWGLRESFMRVPSIVSVGMFLDETSALADLILPDHSFLESWTDAVPESGASTGVISVAAPAMRPLHDTKSTIDVLLDVSAKLQQPLEWAWQTHEALLAASIAALPPAEKDGDVWSEVQGRGGWWGELPPALRRGEPLSDNTPPGRTAPARGATSPPQTETFTAPRFDGDSSTFPLHFLPAASPTFLDGSLAHLPWLQEMPDPLTSAMWSAWVEINPETARGLGIHDGDIVRVTSPHGSIDAAAILSPGIAPTLVAMPAGQGHTTYTRYASGRGVNPFAILAPVTEDVTGALAWAATRVRLERVGPPDGRLVLFAGGLREHGESDHPPHR